MKRLHALFAIVSVASIVILLFVSVNASRGSESCQCFYEGFCHIGEDGKAYRYYKCTGSCVGYSGWRFDGRCYDPQYRPDVPFS